MRARAGPRAHRLAQDLSFYRSPPLSLSLSLSLSLPLSPFPEPSLGHVTGCLAARVCACARSRVCFRTCARTCVFHALRISRFDQGPPVGTVACDTGAPGWAIGASRLRGGSMDEERLRMFLARRRLFCFCPSHLLSSPFFSLSLFSSNSDPGSLSRLFSPLPTPVLA